MNCHIKHSIISLHLCQEYLTAEIFQIVIIPDNVLNVVIFF